MHEQIITFFVLTKRTGDLIAIWINALLLYFSDVRQFQSFVVVVLNEYFIRIQRVPSLNLFSTTQIDLILGG